MTGPRLILASASPRRSQLLSQIGVEHIVSAQDIDESVRADESPHAYVQRMADEKAAAALAAGSEVGDLVLASDTSVVADDLILGKPASEDEAVSMLLSLADREHEVITAVTVANAERWQNAISVSRVRFRAISEEEARSYWRSGEPSDKAGGYAIQGIGAIFVESISGSYSGVMGLPLFETAQLLNAFGMQILPAAAGETA